VFLASSWKHKRAELSQCQASWNHGTVAWAAEQYLLYKRNEEPKASSASKILAVLAKVCIRDVAFVEAIQRRKNGLEASIGWQQFFRILCLRVKL